MIRVSGTWHPLRQDIPADRNSRASGQVKHLAWFQIPDEPCFEHLQNPEPILDEHLIDRVELNSYSRDKPHSALEVTWFDANVVADAKASAPSDDDRLSRRKNYRLQTFALDWAKMVRHCVKVPLPRASTETSLGTVLGSVPRNFLRRVGHPVAGLLRGLQSGHHRAEVS